MNLKSPMKRTFWASVIIAALGVVVYAVHLFAKNIAYLQPFALLLVLVAFVLLCLGITLKNL